MLQGLEDMLVHLTDAADRAHSSALVQPIVQGLKLRSKKSTKARVAVVAHSVGITPHKSSGGRLHPDRTARTASDRGSARPSGRQFRLGVNLLKARALFDYELLLAAVDRRGGDAAHFCLILCQGKGSR